MLTLLVGEKKKYSCLPSIKYYIHQAKLIIKTHKYLYRCQNIFNLSIIDYNYTKGKISENILKTTLI